MPQGDNPVAPSGPHDTAQALQRGAASELGPDGRTRRPQDGIGPRRMKGTAEPEFSKQLRADRRC